MVTALRLSVERGEYVVDSHAVAEAMLCSGVFVAVESRNGALGAEEQEPAAT